MWQFSAMIMQPSSQGLCQIRLFDEIPVTKNRDMGKTIVIAMHAVYNETSINCGKYMQAFNCLAS